MRKITAFIPTEIIDAAVRNSGEGVTETLREALRQYNHRAASARLLAARGKVKFALDWSELRSKDEA